MAARIQPSADVAEDASIGEGSSVWHLAQVREKAQIGDNCIIGRGAYVGPGVVHGRQLQAAEPRPGLRAGRARRTGSSSARRWCSPTTTTRGRSPRTAP